MLITHEVHVPYVYQEYPKWITNKEGKRLIVQNQEEEMLETEVKEDEKGKRGRPRKEVDEEI